MHIYSWHTACLIYRQFKDATNKGCIHVSNRIIFKKEDGIAYLQLNQPKFLNALDQEAYTELFEIAEEVDADEKISVAIIYGSGRAFCAGDNITDGDLIKKRTFLEAYEYIRRMQSAFNRIASIGKPTIAAIHGACCGGGLELALCCDIRIATIDSKIGLPELKLGAIPCIGGTQRLPRLIGTAKAKELLFTSQLISGLEAERLGIVNKAVPSGEQLNEAINMASIIKKRSSSALRMAKFSVDQGQCYTLEMGLEIEARNDAMLFDTHDFYEGMIAFQEKREPEFWGK